MGNNQILIGKKVFIRNCGKDESWLQEIIFSDPKVLGLGDLVPVYKEKPQVSGGRLDILLKSREDKVMYEVEVMLGPTDPSHIIRSIEYWDNEKRKYPQRQHFCVLVAESFDRRYFNVLQLMSLNIPMIAIQADLIEAGDEKILNFVKIVNIYTEPEENQEEGKQANEETWKTISSWTIENAKDLYSVIEKNHEKIRLGFTQSYINIALNSKNAYFFHKRMEPFSLMTFIVKDAEKAELIKTILTGDGISCQYNDNYAEFSVTIDKDIIKKHAKKFMEVDEVRFRKNIEEDEI